MFLFLLNYKNLHPVGSSCSILLGIRNKQQYLTDLGPLSLVIYRDFLSLGAIGNKFLLWNPVSVKNEPGADTRWWLILCVDIVKCNLVLPDGGGERLCYLLGLISTSTTLCLPNESRAEKAEFSTNPKNSPFLFITVHSILCTICPSDDHLVCYSFQSQLE